MKLSRRPSGRVTGCILPMLAALLIVAKCEFAPGTPSSQSRHPNVILILADDLAIGDLASTNGGISKTSNLDRLALESVRFNQAYSASCVCAPARAALLTGRYPHRTGVVTLNMNRYPKLTQLQRDETTIADVMRSNGYATGLIGKWHCGTGADYHPLRRGFDEFEGFSGSQELSYFDYVLDVNGSDVPMKDDYLTDDLSRRAIAFMQRHQHHPFFLHLAHYAPHRPLEAPAKLVEFYLRKGLDESTAIIYAMIEVMDRGIGELIAELERLDLSKRTIVVFASDNGPDPLTGIRFNGDLRGQKYEVHEGGIRVPLWVCWKGKFAPSDRQQLVHFVDLFPTMLDLCGIEHEVRLPIDGRSVRGLLDSEGGDFSNKRYWQWNRGVPNYTHNAALRDGDWKLVKPFVTRGADPKDSNMQPILYDLVHDPSETTDVKADNAERYESMLQNLNRWSDQVEADRIRNAAVRRP